MKATVTVGSDIRAALVACLLVRANVRRAVDNPARIAIRRNTGEGIALRGVATSTLKKAETAGVHRFFLGTLPYFVMAVVVGMEFSPSRGMGGFLSLLSLGPALASVSRRARATAFIGVLAMAVCVSISK